MQGLDTRSNSHNEHVWINQEPKRKVGMRNGFMCDCGVKLTNTRGVANFALSVTIGKSKILGSMEFLRGPNLKHEK
jgi:hypothetical protein